MTKVFLISTVHNALDNRIFYREANSLSHAGYQVSILAVHDKQETKDGISILPLKRVKRWQRPLLWFAVLYHASSSKADLFHIHDPELLFISPFLRLITNRPVIYDVHESFPDFIEIKDDIPLVLRKLLAWLFRWLEPFLASLQSGLIFADDQIAREFKNISIPKTTLFNYPLQTFIDNASHSIKTPDISKPVVLYLGGLKRHRGLSIMLDAFEHVLEYFPHAQLYLVGPFAPASLENEIRSELKRREISSSVLITGGVPFHKVSDYLSRAFIGWVPFPSVKKYQKNIPTKIFEYMAYSIPVVSSNLPPIRQFIENGRTGILVQAESPTAHAEAIIELLSNPLLAATIGANGFEMVNHHYHWTEMEPRLIELYKRVLNKRS